VAIAMTILRIGIDRYSYSTSGSNACSGRRCRQCTVQSTIQYSASRVIRMPLSRKIMYRFMGATACRHVTPASTQREVQQLLSSSAILHLSPRRRLSSRLSALTWLQYSNTRTEPVGSWAADLFQARYTGSSSTTWCTPCVQHPTRGSAPSEPAFVQSEIRYTRSRLGKLASALPPDEVLRRRYGDCKERRAAHFLYRALAWMRDRFC